MSQIFRATQSYVQVTFNEPETRQLASFLHLQDFNQ